ncbi:MAG: gfo/Idh/MocA family oxidoreductase, partial [Planctomycetota bacterium]
SRSLATAMMKFSSGCVGVLQCYFGTVDTPDRLEIIGTEGRIQIEDLNAGVMTISKSSGTTQEHHPPHPNFNAPLIADFTEAIETGRPVAIDGDRGAAVNQVIDEIYQDSIA